MMVLQTLFRFFCCSLKGIVTPGSKFQIFAKDFTIHSTKYIFLSFFFLCTEMQFNWNPVRRIKKKKKIKKEALQLA